MSGETGLTAFCNKPGKIINTAQTKVTGTYQVENDCTVNFDIGVFKLDGNQVDLDTLFGVIVDHGKKVRALITKTDIAGTHSAIFEQVKSNS